MIELSLRKLFKKTAAVIMDYRIVNDGGNEIYLIFYGIDAIEEMHEHISAYLITKSNRLLILNRQSCWRP